MSNVKNPQFDYINIGSYFLIIINLLHKLFVGIRYYIKILKSRFICTDMETCDTVQ